MSGLIVRDRFKRCSLALIQKGVNMTESINTDESIRGGKSVKMPLSTVYTEEKNSLNISALAAVISWIAMVVN